MRRKNLLTLLILFAFTFGINAEGENFKLFIDADQIHFREDLGYPFFAYNRTFVPIRFIADNLGYGCNCKW